jgi:hypothetical protein
MDIQPKKHWIRSKTLLGLILLAIAAVIISTIILLRPQETNAPSTDNTQQTTPKTTEVQLTGTLVCLPHKNTDGPQTMECLTGLRTNDGTYYQLIDPDREFLRDTPFNKSVEVKGTLQTGTDEKYQSKGTITLTDLQPKS